MLRTPRSDVPTEGAGAASAEGAEVQLIRRIARGEPRAFDQLYRAYHPRLTRFIDRLTRQPGLVGELLNDTMFVVWTHAARYNGQSKVSTWIFAIAYRKALKAMGRRDEPMEAAQEDDAEEPAKSDEKTATTSGGLSAKNLALTKDATGIEYKALVEQLVFKSKSNVKSVCAELAASLKAQGWQNDGIDMVNPQSSILKRKQGEATLTIFVKPDNGGSEVKMLTDGLSWD